ncbi:MAG: GNAT family protein [Myxococcota bacterium]
MNPPEAIETARLSLRRPDPERDAPVMLARWASDPEVTRFLLWPTYHPEDVASAASFLAGCVANWEADVGHRPWMLVPRGDPAGAPIGMIGVTPHAAHMAEVGYVMARASWGQGLMGEAARAVVLALFADPAVWRVFAPAHVLNRRSHRVLEKAGMFREGTLRRHLVYANLGPEPQDSALFAVTRDDLGSQSP